MQVSRVEPPHGSPRARQYLAGDVALEVHGARAGHEDAIEAVSIPETCRNRRATKLPVIDALSEQTVSFGWILLAINRRGISGFRVVDRYGCIRTVDEADGSTGRTR